MAKNRKTRVITVLIILLISMLSLGINKVYAEPIKDSHIENAGIVSNQVKLTYDNLASYWYILCDQHNQHIPSISQITTAKKVTNPKEEKSVKSYLEGDFYNIKSPGKWHLGTDEIGKSAAKEWGGTDVEWTSETISTYKNEIEHKRCFPESAYILNFAGDNEGDYPTYVQIAWWMTDENEGDPPEKTTPKSASLANAAKAYQDFVGKLLIEENGKKIDLKDTSNYDELEHTYEEDGSTVTIPFPKIDVKSTFAFNTKDAEVSFDKKRQKYLIGPYTLTYINDSYKDQYFDDKFGYIDKFDIYTNDGPAKLSEDRWKFVYLKPRMEQNGNENEFENWEKEKYPMPGEEFYIEMDYMSDVTRITGIDIDYKYLIAGGEYEKLDGKYSKVKWKCEKETGESYSVYDSDGNWLEDKFYEEYYLTAKVDTHPESQKLAWVTKAARWYETEKISTKFKESTLKIEKKAIDENGKEFTAEEIRDIFGKDQYFDFKVTITYPQYNADGTDKVEENIVTVKAGSTATVGTYLWTDEQNAPRYEVEEISFENHNAWKKESIENGSGELEKDKTVEVIAKNKLIKKQGKLKLTKTLSEPASESELFSFEVIVTMPNGVKDIETVDIIVPKGQTKGNDWTSEYYCWYGNKRPTYEIIEIETKHSKEYEAIITPSKGYLKGDNAVIRVNAYNNKKLDKFGYLTIEKDLTEGQITDEIFEFDVTVTGANNAGGELIAFSVNLKAGEKAGPYKFAWSSDKSAPTFTVTEKSQNSIKDIGIEVTGADDVKKPNNNTVEGRIRDSSSENQAAHVNVKFINEMEKHSGKIEVSKDFFSTEKLTPEELKELVEAIDVKFDVEVVIQGTFKYGNDESNQKSVQNSSLVINQQLTKDNGWKFETENITWFGSEAPTYTVKEVNLPPKWKCRSITYTNTENESTDTEGHKVIAGDNEVTIVNEIPSNEEIDLTFEMAGIVWEDKILDEKNTENNGYYSEINGIYDPKYEALVENAEVIVYKVVYDENGNEVSRKVATAYQDAQKNELTFPIITKTDGAWYVPRIQVPGLTEEDKLLGGTAASYDVEFAYDGEKYEPTKFLASGTVEDFKAGTSTNRVKYEKNSMAIEIENNTKNIMEVSGKSAIDANGDTTGKVKLKDGTEQIVTYSSNNAGVGYPTQSRINTVDSNGRLLDIFKAKATTSKGGITVPFDKDGYDGSSLTAVDKYITEEGTITTSYKFTAVYNYCLHINLGLKKRPDTDIALTKNLDNAVVVVNERMYQYKYSHYYDLTEQKTDTLDKNIFVDKATEDVQYTLGLYRSDYYYRAEMYEKGHEDLYEALENFYATLDKEVSDTELDIYLTYKIKLQNNSSAYDVRINSLDDYYDNSFTLITEDQYKYLKTATEEANEADKNTMEVVAKASDYANYWETVNTGTIGSDMNGEGKNIIYNKMTANNLGIVLKPGEEKELTVRFKVNKDNDKEFSIENSIKLGQKCNVAEIANYTVLNAGTQDDYAGKIDRDSAPSNVNIQSHNEKVWYEDDTFAAPRIKLKLVDENNDRKISGTVWEDNSKDIDTEKPDERYNQEVGNGIKSSREDSIKGLTTQLVEKKAVNIGGNTYTEFDFIWPTGEELSCLGNRTMEEIMGLDTTIETDHKGDYTFNNVIAGDYVVRFIYGDKSGMGSADYSVAKYYNGQDYKSARFKGDLRASQDNTKIKADSYLDIDKVNDYTETKNTAVDSEVRRLEVVANSREIMYENNSIMYNYEPKLFNDYWMYADTPKLDMNIELSKKYYNAKDNNEYNQNNGGYTVQNVDFAVEERPITQLTLDKQIEEIILTTSDGNNIMDAKYNIRYDENELRQGRIKAIVELDTANSYGFDNLQALNRDDATNKGFRYINIDSTILEGTTITVKYKFTVLNTGEVDRTGQLANMDYAKDKNELPDASNKLATKFATYQKSGNVLKNETEPGRYVGYVYYYGADRGKDADAVVTSTVRQLVDYIDNDVMFSGVLNASKDMSWGNVTVDELRAYIDPKIIKEGVIADNKGVQYQTDNRNNLVVSVDTKDPDSSAEDTTLNNKGFIVQLQPFNAYSHNSTINYQASMYLTTTKYIGSDSDDLQIDNIAEIIKYNNKVGRRDELTVVGNQDPSVTVEKTPSPDTTLEHRDPDNPNDPYERDTSVTEIITLSPPTGSSIMVWRLQVIASVTAGLVMIAGGIVFIKKKILK